ncbi:hypothetical protein TL16_g07623 [Triparma laevis f. inornata]|uniref:Leucine-rich repeat domain-containing protein n=2 Tax=Triparma laevis TaxID=1534972 RepID=A0A9W7AA19_9STRA|nr:hypothetical protein TrLO_g12707 [Triparma laevis f. longispina]GMH78002.1 hypothetical protein TL16_g07623 [Triparma laevis f. inornata]
MHTPEFRRHFVDFVPVDALMILRCATKGWKAQTDTDAFIDKGVKSGELIVHDGRDFSYEDAEARRERHALVTRVIFLLDITKVGDRACLFTANFFVFYIPEGIEIIGECAFYGCTSLTTVSFPTTLIISIGFSAFNSCSSLDNVALLHTNLKVLGKQTFDGCSGQTSMTIPDSLQTLGQYALNRCSNLVPRNIKLWKGRAVVAYLRSL